MVRQYKCKVCNNEWQARKYPDICPKCLYHFWDIGDNIQCQVCKDIALIPYVYYKDNNEKNRSMENMIVVCVKCFQSIHNGIKKPERARLIKSWNDKKNIFDYDNPLDKIKFLRNDWLEKNG